MENASSFIQPTRFTGEYPTAWAGYTFLDYDQTSDAYHPGEDYNFGGGNDDLGQDVSNVAAGIVVHASNATTGYGNMVVIKHSLGYNLQRFIKETYGIDTKELYSLYAHLKDITVKVGDKVTVGQVIGHVGNTGTKWAHLHFELYAPIGELSKVAWRFYPTVKNGWSKEKVKQFWVPAYKFIEATKQLDDLRDSFMGKPKAYWEQVEKDRESLLKQIGEIDKIWAIRCNNIEKELQNKISTLEGLVTESVKIQEAIATTAQKERENFNIERQKLEDEVKQLKIDNSRLLQDNAENYKFWEGIKLVLEIFKKNTRI